MRNYRNCFKNRGINNFINNIFKILWLTKLILIGYTIFDTMRDNDAE